MKIVINVCFGGFSLSYLAVKRLAELNGKQCFAFDRTYPDKEYHLVENPINDGLFLSFFSTNDVEIVNRITTADNWHSMSEEERQKHNEEYDKYALTSRPEDRTDPLLIQVVEELGALANGSCARLKVVEIPDGIDYTIEEYDGSEHVAEVHQTWS